MKKKTVIEITKSDILELYISMSEGCTRSEAMKIIPNANMQIEISERGDYDKGNFKQDLEKITIEYEK